MVATSVFAIHERHNSIADAYIHASPWMEALWEEAALYLALMASHLANYSPD